MLVTSIKVVQSDASTTYSYIHVRPCGWDSSWGECTAPSESLRNIPPCLSPLSSKGGGAFRHSGHSRIPNFQNSGITPEYSAMPVSNFGRRWCFWPMSGCVMTRTVSDTIWNGPLIRLFHTLITLCPVSYIHNDPCMILVSLSSFMATFTLWQQAIMNLLLTSNKQASSSSQRERPLQTECWCSYSYSFYASRNILLVHI
jgi:hypothetical protein